MKFDIVFVTYNSEKWIDKCVDSILKSKYNLKNISLLFCDNLSSDNTVSKIKDIKEKYANKFDKIEFVVSNKNRGFGCGNNEAVKLGDAPYIFFLNVDTELNQNTLEKIENHINDSEESYAMWELSQRPYEHPKYYDPLTWETSWASGACMIVKRSVFDEVGGFDHNIFMYCEDVEISWNFRKHGYKIKYLADTPITHYSYSKPNEFKYTQFVYGFISNWYLRAKYGNFKNFLRGLQYLIKLGVKGEYIPSHVDSLTNKKIRKLVRYTILGKFVKYTFINFTTNKMKFIPKFVAGFDYEIIKENPFYVQPKMKTTPLVSVIVRTCNRKEALRENLISLRNQTYKDIEIVIVEDGKNTAEEMIKKEFKDLNIVYEATGKNVGRSKVANIAMKKAKGKYLNFLDDDDLFFPDHVETLVKVLENNNYDIVYDGSFETKIDVISREPYQYEVKAKGLYEGREFNRKRLYKINLFPIQTVMFKKTLFEECGGFDEKIDALEDWDFWIRLSLNHQFHQVLATTSVFRTPYNDNIQKDREDFLASTLEYLQEKFKSYKPTMTVNDYNKE